MCIRDSFWVELNKTPIKRDIGSAPTKERAIYERATYGPRFNHKRGVFVWVIPMEIPRVVSVFRLLIHWP